MLVKFQNSKVILIQKSNLNNFECLILAKIKFQQFWNAEDLQNKEFQLIKMGRNWKFGNPDS